MSGVGWRQIARSGGDIGGRLRGMGWRQGIRAGGAKVGDAGGVRASGTLAASWCRRLARGRGVVPSAAGSGECVAVGGALEIFSNESTVHNVQGEREIKLSVQIF
jgi:hypothetical protein